MYANFDPHFYIKYNGNIIIEANIYNKMNVIHDENDALSLIPKQYLIKIKM